MSNNSHLFSIGNVKEVNQATGEVIYRDIGIDEANTAFPLDPGISFYPIPGELILIVSTTNPYFGTGINNDINVSYYISSLNIWKNPSDNGVSSPDDSNRILFPLEVLENIQPLFSLPGDRIIEGRFGNTIRLGNTNSNFENGWSENGNNGDPITIISNGQSPENPTNIENIQKDLSSLYLTSYQKISNFSLINENFKAYKNPPQTPASYSFPQIILNSNRIILNAKKDNILISGEKSVGISSNGTINIESKNGIIMDGIIKLGATDADESALLGDTTVSILLQLIETIASGFDALGKNVKDYAGPVTPIPNSGVLSTSSNVLTQINKIKKRINDVEEGPKSNKVKIKR